MKKGFFILTGSQNYLLNEKISQSLAGRIAITTLLPLSLEELKRNNYLLDSPYELIFKGSYPQLYAEKIRHEVWYSSYQQTYLERDIRQLSSIQNLGTFERFIKLCAGRIGQLVDYTSLANDCDVTVTTVKEWLSLLQSSYLIFNLMPYHTNFNKRVTKSSKLYFYDTGLACYLLGIKTSEQLDTHYLRGGLFENFIVSELYKYYTNQGVKPLLYFWREESGHEVDCLTEKGGSLFPIEIKANSTAFPRFFDGLRYFNGVSQSDPKNNTVIYTGKDNQTWSYGDIVSWRSLEILFRKLDT